MRPGFRNANSTQCEKCYNKGRRKCYLWALGVEGGLFFLGRAGRLHKGTSIKW